MQLFINGKHLDITNALRAYIEKELNRIESKFEGKINEVNIIFAKDAHLFRVDISIQAGRNIQIFGNGEATDAYIAFDKAAERVTLRLRKHKTRLHDIHTRKAPDRELMASYAVLETEEKIEDEAEGADAPVIVAEMTTPIDTMSVSEAVMRLDLSQKTAMMFRNAGHGGLNMVYRRNDGNIGWIDPNIKEAA